jgi:chitinase
MGEIFSSTNFILPSNKKAIYYHTSWSGDSKDYHVSDIPNCILDIAYGCWYVDNIGNISSTDSWADTDKRFVSNKFVPPADSWDDNDNFYGNFGQFKKLKEKRKEKQQDINISLVLGAWIINNFLSIVNNNNNSLNFINNIIIILRNYTIFSGIVIDFVKIGKQIKEDDYINFILLLKKLKKALISNGFYINIDLCCSAIPEDCNFDILKLNTIIDRIYIMTLDFNIDDVNNVTNHHTNPRKSAFGKYSCEDSVDYYLSKGINSEKLYITSALYSRGYANTDGLGKPGISINNTWDQGKIDYKYLPLYGSEEFIDKESKAAYSYDKKNRIFNSYDNKYSVIEKCDIIKQKNLGGLFVYENSSDKDITDLNSIIGIVRDNLTHIRPIRLSAIPMGLARPYDA